MVQDGWTSVDKWLSRMSPITQKKGGQRFRAWMKWVKQSKTDFKDFTPDELVSFQQEATNHERFKILDEIVQPYILSKKGRYSTKQRYYITVKSFFAHNRAELPRDKSFRVRGDEAKTRGHLPVDEIKNVVLSSNPLYQAVFLSMFQGAMGLEEFDYWNKNGWEELDRHISDGIHPIKVDLPGRKKYRYEKPYYTLLGKDAVDAVRFYVNNHRPNKVPIYHEDDVKLDPDKRRVEGWREVTAIFVTKFGEPVTKNAVYQYWLRHLRKIGLTDTRQAWEEGGKNFRTGKNPHEMRDTFRSQWAKSGRAPEVAEFLMGHQVDPMDYNKAHQDEGWVRAEFLEAERFLNIISDTRPFRMVSEDRVEELEAEIARLKAERKSMITKEEHSQLLSIIEDLKRRMDDYDKTKG